MSCGISPPFGGLSPSAGQVAHVLRTRAPCAHSLYCYRKLRTRLACVKHAASVRSEPGSNSRLNWLFRRQKIPANFAGTSSSERTYLSRARLPVRGACARLVSLGLTHITERVLARLIQLSKNRPPVRQAGLRTILYSTIQFPDVKLPSDMLGTLSCATASFQEAKLCHAESLFSPHFGILWLGQYEVEALGRRLQVLVLEPSRCGPRSRLAQNESGLRLRPPRKRSK
jgi:hypothetical protein